MNAKESAEKITKLTLEHSMLEISDSAFIEKILMIVREAEQEAFRKGATMMRDRFLNVWPDIYPAQLK